MTKVTIPNETGPYEVDGISIMVFPKTIVIDTGNRRNDNRGSYRNNDRRDDDDRRDNGRRDNRRKDEKKSTYNKDDPINKLLDSAQAFVMGKDSNRK